MRYRKSKIGLLALLLLCFFIGSGPLRTADAGAQDDVTSFRPRAEAAPPGAYDTSALKATIKKDTVFIPIMAYAAVRAGDLSLCDRVHDSAKCKKDAADLMDARYFAAGQCEDVFPAFQNICRNIDSCEELGGWEKDMCLGYKEGKVAPIKAAQSTRDFCKKAAGGEECGKSSIDTAEIKESLAVFYGFKHYGSKGACEKFAKGLKGHQAYLCEVLFGTNGLEQVLEATALDLTYFTHAKQYKDKSLCDKIKGEDLKQKCLSSKVRGLEGNW